MKAFPSIHASINDKLVLCAHCKAQRILLLFFFVKKIYFSFLSPLWPEFFEILHFQITVLVAAEGIHKLPVINGSADLKEALQKLGSIPLSKTLVGNNLKWI